MLTTLFPFFFGLISGASVLGVIALALIWVSSNDPITRN